MTCQKKKIAIIGSQAFALWNFRGPLIQEMVKRNLEVYALAPDYDNETREKVRKLGAKPVQYRLSRTGLNPFRDALDFLGLIATLRRIRPDVTFSYTIKPVIYGTLAAWILSVPRRFAMITGLGYTFAAPGEQEEMKRRVVRTIAQFLYKLALRRATKVFFQNSDDLNEFVQRKLIPTEKAFLLGPTGVDLEVFTPGPPVSEPITFILAARLLREKGVLEFVEAARRIKAKYPNTRFILLGGLDTNPGAIPKEEVEGWVKEGLIEWPGHVADVRPYLAQASVFVLPSYYREGVPRSIQEAMAMARPIITTDAPGCRETVIPGVNGFLVPVRNVDALVSAMERFINEPELIERMGKESRRIAEERFDVHKINRVLLEAMGL
jgi:glycosyltransferase involved in cell wall biosynthesis